MNPKYPCCVVLVVVHVTNGIPKIMCGFRIGKNFNQVMLYKIKNPRHYQLIFG
jgi:hypothetical protein